MANIPHKYTQEAQDERNMKRRLENPKSRWSWQIGRGLTQKEWSEIFEAKNKDRR
jgi:hypothetical protein